MVRDSWMGRRCPFLGGPLVALLWCACIFSIGTLHMASAFSPPRIIIHRSNNRLQENASIRSRIWMETKENENDVDDMKHEIEELRQEALRRIDAMSIRMSSSSSSSSRAEDSSSLSASTSSAVPNNDTQQTSSTSMDGSQSDDTTTSSDTEQEFVKQIAVSNSPATTNLKSTSLSEIVDERNLLDGTHWKVMLNIGREPGTWMPKTWGVSGERLLLSLEVKFTEDQLYEREEFLNGVGGAKIVHVVQNKLTLGPSMTEGSKVMTVKDGGWKIGKGEGPMGTDILRFFVEDQLQSLSTSSNSNLRGSGVKEQLKKKQEELRQKYDRITEEMEEDTSLFSIKKLRLTKDLVQCRLDSGKVTQQLNEALIREPSKSLLRLSRTRNVGLTREGGVCCKVTKGVAMEYHIVGKFGVAAVDPRSEDENTNTPNIMRP
eukprot:scaffold4523_cov50-Attheya_sp.AAC.2